MALSRTNLGGDVKPASGSNFGTGSYSPPAVTPPDNSLLVVAVMSIENGSGTNPAADLAISDTGSHTWTAQFKLNTTGGFATTLAIYTCSITTGAATTITFTCAGRNMGIWASSIVAYTGDDDVSPIGTSQSLISNTSGGGPPNPVSMTLPLAPASTSEVFAAVAADRSSAGVTPGSTFTEIDDVSNPTASTGGGLQTEVRTGSTSTTVDWVDIRAGGGNLFNYIAAAVEIVQASGVAAVSPDGIAVAVALGAPSITIVGAAPDGIAVPVQLGAPTAGDQPAPSVQSDGGWYGLLSVLAERANTKRIRESMPPASCPHDGEPLISDGKGGLKCRFDGWQWPKDGGAIR